MRGVLVCGIKIKYIEGEGGYTLCIFYEHWHELCHDRARCRFELIPYLSRFTLFCIDLVQRDSFLPLKSVDWYTSLYFLTLKTVVKRITQHQANVRGKTNEKRKKLSTYTKAERPDLEQKKTTKNDPFQTTTQLYAFQIRRRASVTPTSFVSNSYRPTAVVRVKARRSHLHRE